jgi:hypothetical protein
MKYLIIIYLILTLNSKATTIPVTHKDSGGLGISYYEILNDLSVNNKDEKISNMYLGLKYFYIIKSSRTSYSELIVEPYFRNFKLDNEFLSNEYGLGLYYLYDISEIITSINTLFNTRISTQVKVGAYSSFINELKLNDTNSDKYFNNIGFISSFELSYFLNRYIDLTINYNFEYMKHDFIDNKFVHGIGISIDFLLFEKRIQDGDYKK